MMVAREKSISGAKIQYNMVFFSLFLNHCFLGEFLFWGGGSHLTIKCSCWVGHFNVNLKGRERGIRG